ncbi:hypothetical protein EYF80_034340 [Liparis tanakae]|uniref:Uncharacterized protein n=1 Tax=Liparis tanakae TaxID=230148 RepID=A0A4Z2GP75_9TELE|nr:hypothetical protein EYF80_034340 [Liparis tanakae]
MANKSPGPGGQSGRSIIQAEVEEPHLRGGHSTSRYGKGRCRKQGSITCFIYTASCGLTLQLELASNVLERVSDVWPSSVQPVPTGQRAVGETDVVDGNVSGPAEGPAGFKLDGEFLKNPTNLYLAAMPRISMVTRCRDELNKNQPEFKDVKKQMRSREDTVTSANSQSEEGGADRSQSASPSSPLRSTSTPRAPDPAGIQYLGKDNRSTESTTEAQRVQ